MAAGGGAGSPRVYIPSAVGPRLPAPPRTDTNAPAPPPLPARVPRPLPPRAECGARCRTGECPAGSWRGGHAHGPNGALWLRCGARSCRGAAGTVSCGGGGERGPPLAPRLPPRALRWPRARLRALPRRRRARTGAGGRLFSRSRGRARACCRSPLRGGEGRDGTGRACVAFGSPFLLLCPIPCPSPVLS